MSSKPVELLPDANPLDGTELVHVVQSGSSRKVAVNQLGGVEAGAATTYYHYGSFAVTSIGASEVLMDHIAASDHTLGDNFPDNVASCGTLPAADWVADVQLNGASIGSLTIASVDGTATWVSTGGATAVVAGDVVSVIGPASADAAIARLRFTFKGSIG